MKTPLMFVVMLVLAGCGSGGALQPRAEYSRMPFLSGSRGNVAATIPDDTVGLLPGGAQVTVPLGIFRVRGSNAEGLFWARDQGGIVRSDEASKSHGGGIYCPFDPAKPCLIWIYPRSRTSPIDGGPAASSDDNSVIYLCDVPVSLSATLRTYF